jgi:hypothetical protein
MVCALFIGMEVVPHTRRYEKDDLVRNHICKICGSKHIPTIGILLTNALWTTRIRSTDLGHFFFAGIGHLFCAPYLHNFPSEMLELMKCLFVFYVCFVHLNLCGIPLVCFKIIYHSNICFKETTEYNLDTLT